jgi:hypothetical protein
VEGKGGAAADAIKLQANRQGEAISCADIKQLQLSDLKAKATMFIYDIHTRYVGTTISA